MSWFVIVALAVGTAAQRLVGMFAAGAVIARHRGLTLLADLLPVAIIAAVIAQLSFTRGRSLVVDDRVVGLAVAGILVWRRAPLVVVVLASAGATALVRSI
ncbi:MAG: AzlD domain-containing protein [Acidimicrobiales bacterium]